TTGSTTLAAGLGPSSVVLTDIDGDRLTDIVVSSSVASTSVNHVVVLRNQGGGKFSPAEPTGSAMFPADTISSLVAANFHGGQGTVKDLALVSSIGPSGSGNEAGSVTVLINSVVSSRSRRAV